MTAAESPASAIVRDEWLKAVRDLNLRPGSKIEQLCKRIIARLEALTTLSGDAATNVYGQLVLRHLKHFRNQDDAQKERVFSLIEAFEAEFPAECKAWNDAIDAAKPKEAVSA